MPSSGKDARRLNSLPAAPGTTGILMLRQQTYNKLRDSVNFISSGGTGKSSKTKLGKRVLAVSSEQLDAFTAVTVGSGIIDPSDDEKSAEYAYVHTFNVTPTSEGDGEEVIGILQRQCPDGEPTPMVLSGVSAALINVADVTHKYAKPSATDGILESTDEETNIRILHAYAPGEKMCKVLLGSGAGGGAAPIVPVSLSQVGGEQGDGTTMPSWRYDVTDLESGEVVLNDADPTASPHHWRRHLGQMAEADYGLAYKIDDETYELTWINEILLAAICEEEPDPVAPEGPDGPAAPET